MKNIILTVIIFISISVSFNAFAQNEDLQTGTYEELYDNPYDIAKLYIHLQPIYGEVFSLNATAGFGLQAHYYHEDVFDIMVHGRTSYAKSFDLMKSAASNKYVEDPTNPTQSSKGNRAENAPASYMYFEAIATYHIVDREEDVQSKFILYSKRYKGDKWAATVPKHTMIPTKMRRVYGARAGALHYTTALQYNRILEDQGNVLRDNLGNPIDPNYSVYGKLQATGFVLGASMTLIKNVAVQPDKIYGTLVNDLIFTAYFDIIATPFTSLDNIYIRESNSVDPTEYPVDNDVIQTSFIGARAGLEGKFNRPIGFGYGIELGYRPGIQGKGMYLAAKMSFPVFSTHLRHNVEFFGK